MDSASIRELVRLQIGDAWDESNLHGVDIRKSLVTPKLIKVIERDVRNGRIQDRMIDAWLVMIEHPETDSGYRIVASIEGKKYGLASKGFPADKHLVVSGWYRNFMAAFRAM